MTVPFLPYGRQSVGPEDRKAVDRVLSSDFLTCGHEVEAFEAEFAEAVGAKYAVAVCNATAALHLAMLVADIGPGDRVVTSPITFLSSANCAAFVGATPDFSDIQLEGVTLCPETLEKNWKGDTRAVVAVDYAGHPSHYPELARIARANGAVVIADSCHGPGSRFRYKDKVYALGGHPWADITTFSFHPVKTLTTGEGGMLVTDVADYADKARRLRTHGMVRESGLFQHFVENEALNKTSLFAQGPWVYEMQELGYNYRITDIQCALGRSQLAKLPWFVARRQAIVAEYNRAFRGVPWLRTPEIVSGNLNPSFHMSPDELSWHLYTLEFDFDALGLSRAHVMASLRDQGIGTQVLYIPVYLQPWYANQYGYTAGKCPQAEAFYRKALSLPLYPEMSPRDQSRVIQAVYDLVAGRE